MEQIIHLEGNEKTEERIVEQESSRRWNVKLGNREGQKTNFIEQKKKWGGGEGKATSENIV